MLQYGLDRLAITALIKLYWYELSNHDVAETKSQVRSQMSMKIKYLCGLL